MSPGAEERLGPGRPLDALNARGLSAKREYVHGLEQRRDPEALSLLIECLCDESWFLRDLAEQAFVRLGEDHAQGLLPLLEGGLWYTRTSAARLLGRVGYRPAVPGLLRLCEDSNETAALAACDAVVALARNGGAARLAYALHRLPPEPRRQRLTEIARRDRALVGRLERLMHNEDIMTVEDPDSLSDESELVRASEEGFEWEVLTGPAPRKEPPRETPSGNDAPPAS